MKRTLNLYRRIGIIGGNGFLGKTLAKELSSTHSILSGVRSPSELKIDSTKYPNWSVCQADILNQSSLTQLVEQSDVIINTTNITFESESTFRELYVDGTKNIATLVRKMGKEYIHFSVNNSSLDSTYWSDLKFRGEDMAYASHSECVVLKPSFIFSPENTFLNSICSRVKFGPVAFLPGGSIPCQPIHVDEVVKIVKRIIDDKIKGKVYQLCGDKVMSLSEVIKTQFRLSNREPSVISLPYIVGDVILGVTQFLPNPIMSREVYNLLQTGQVEQPLSYIQSDVSELRINN